MSVSAPVSNCDLTELEEDELLAVSEPEDGPGPAFEFELDTKENDSDARPRKRKAETKTNTKSERSAEGKRSKKALCTDALKMIEERARARWASEPDSDPHPEREPEPEPEPDRLQLGVWLPSGSTFAAEVEARVRVERGVELVWDADKDDFEGLSAAMLRTTMGLRCGVAARRAPSTQVELRGRCRPKS
jgi:hypothetical protein